MRETVFLRDWYYNAGLVGFLKIVCDGDFDKRENFGDKLLIGEDYIEFDLDILNDFENKFYKQLFLNYFDLGQYQNYISKALKNEQDKKSPSIQKILKVIDKFPFVGLYNALGYKLDTYEDILNYKKEVDVITKEQVYYKTKETDFVVNFAKQVTKGIIGLSNLTTYLKSTENRSFELKKDSDKPCMLCQTRKREFEFSNAMSNIIGFNKDNANWIWGFNSAKAQICSICSLIYLSASVSLVLHKKGSNYTNCFYFINHNRNIQKLIDSYTSFKSQVDQIETQEIYPVMVKEVVKFIKQEEASQSLHNVSFIEIQENNMGGQSTKGYNVYSFSINNKLAEFIKNNIDKIPKGYYVIKKDYFDIEYEILRKTIERTLYYNDIDRYIRMHLLAENKNANIQFKSNINKIISYIMSYITYMLKGGVSVDLETISKKGFVNGKKLREKLGKERENQINGLAYQFLNDLRVGDKDRFLDKYLRISISNQLESSFGLEEMNNKEAFLHFGYSFVNGLLSTYENKNNQGDQE